MKKILFLFLFVASQVAVAQKMKIDIKPTTALMFVECVPIKYPAVIDTKVTDKGLVAVQAGYVTQGYTFGNMAINHGSLFTIELQKITPLQAGYQSKSMAFTDIIDATGKVDKPDAMDKYTGTIVIKGTELNTPLFTSAISKSFSAYGYNMDTNTVKPKNKIKLINTELGISAQLVYCSKETRGPGFQVSIVVEWTVYSYTEQKEVLFFQTGGYSDTQQPLFNQELSLAFKDAVQGLLINPDFQQIAGK